MNDRSPYSNSDSDGRGDHRRSRRPAAPTVLPVVRPRRFLYWVVFLLTPIVAAAALSEVLLRLIDPQDLTGS